MEWVGWSEGHSSLSLGENLQQKNERRKRSLFRMGFLVALLFLVIVFSLAKFPTQKVENRCSFWSEVQSPYANNFLTWSFLPRFPRWDFAHIFLSHTDIPDIGMCSTIPFVQAVHRLKPKLFLVPITDVSLCSIFNSDVGTCPGCPGDMNLG